MIPRYVLLEKKLGQTPLQAIEAWKESKPRFKDVPATYAGRLDPMAEGSLLVLLGDECKHQEKYRGLDKEYVIEVLLDLSTDTGDVLGMPHSTGKETHPQRKDISRILKSHTGTRTIPYPSFSSKTVAGIPLFEYALRGTLDSIDIPTHTETVYRIALLSIISTEKEALRERIMDTLSAAPRSLEESKRLGADFRQDEIRESWGSLFEVLPDRMFTILTLRIACASGTYMRTLAERIGKNFQTDAFALSIRRTKIGSFKNIFGGFWTHTYH